LRERLFNPIEEAGYDFLELRDTIHAKVLQEFRQKAAILIPEFQEIIPRFLYWIKQTLAQTGVELRILSV
jgi:hypothetical protein